MNVKKNKWQAFATDFASPFIRNYIWTKGMTLYPKLFGINQAVLGINYFHNKIEYICKADEWRKLHLNLVKLIQNDPKKLDKIITDTNKSAIKFVSWTQKNIFNVKLEKLPVRKLVSLYNEFIEEQAQLYCLGVVLPAIDDGDNSFIEINLNNFLRRKLPAQVRAKYYEIFTKIRHKTFSQLQETELLKLTNKYYNNKKWIKTVLTKEFAEVISHYPGFFKDLSRHTKKHAWVYYVYMGPAFKEEDYYNFIKDIVTKGTSPQKLLHKKTILQKRDRLLLQQAIKRLRPNKFELAIIDMASKLIWAKPYRKEFQSLAYYHFEKLQSEIAKRVSLSLNQVRSMPLSMLTEVLVNNKSINLNIINQISNQHVCLPEENGRVKVIYGKNAQIFNKNLERYDEPIKHGIKQLVGVSACGGSAVGEVKIINTALEMNKMRAGDVLVAVATSPTIIAAMKKAAAIITDEGGLTCHAAIVSRELQVPCVIGTRIATKLLKDGDRVQVDANRGIVKIIR